MERKHLSSEFLGAIIAGEIDTRLHSLSAKKPRREVNLGVGRAGGINLCINAPKASAKEAAAAGARTMLAARRTWLLLPMLLLLLANGIQFNQSTESFFM